MAIAVNMHLIAVALIADLWWLNKKGQGLKLDAIEPMLKAIVNDKIIFAGPVSDPKMNSSLGFAGINDTTRQATKVDGGYIINGRSGFGTMSACADYLLTTARYNDPEKGAQCLLCFLPSNTEYGEQINPSDPQSQLSTQSMKRHDSQSSLSQKLILVLLVIVVFHCTFHFEVLPFLRISREREKEKIGNRLVFVFIIPCSISP